MTIRLHVLALPGALDSALGTVLDVVAAANRLCALRGQRPAFALNVVAFGGRSLKLGSGLRLSGLAPALPCRGRDAVVVPGANQATEADVLAWLQAPAVQRAMRWLAAAHASGARIYAGCTGTFVAAECGALAGGAATTTWWLAPSFARRYAGVRLEMQHVLVQSGRVCTAGAAFAHADLVLRLVEQLACAELARLCARYLLLDGRRLHASYPVLGRLAPSDGFAERAERWAQAHLAERFTAAQWAAALHTSARTLARRLRAASGLAPLQFVQRLRVARALHLIETTRAPIESVAAQVGYTDTAALRRLLRRAVQASPRELRSRVAPRA